MQELSANSKILSQSSLIHIVNKALQKDKVFHIRYKTEQKRRMVPAYWSTSRLWPDTHMELDSSSQKRDMTLQSKFCDV